MAVYDGLRKYFATKVQTAIKICSIISCVDTQSKESCARRLATDKPTAERFEFSRLKLEAEVTQTDNSAVAMANTLTRTLKPLESNQFNFDIQQQK